MNAPRNQILRAWTIQISSPGKVLQIEGGADAMFEISSHGSVKKLVLYGLTPADARMIIAALTPLAEVSEMNAPKKHRHSRWFDHNTVRAFRGCVNPQHCDPRAHGHLEIVYRCKCGATRTLNVNQEFIERAKWEVAR